MGYFGAIVLTVLASGCLLTRAQRSNDDLAQIVTLSGELRGGTTEGKPRWAVLYKLTDGRWFRYSQLVFQQTGHFDFLCLPGSYRLFAFEDQNEDWSWQSDEPAALADVSIARGQAAPQVDVTLGRLNEGPGFEVALARDETLTEELVEVHTGDLAQLSDDRFSPAAGQLGLWQAADFARKWGVGVSFLEPYSPTRTPVLFVHGAGGTPRDFELLISGLDRARFQAWVVSYPSGIRITVAGMMLRQICEDLRQRLGFQTVYVVAHSMGGLVAREFIRQAVEQGPPDYVGLLVTISTPWNGVRAARTGVERSPVVLPSWNDVAEGSPFLAGLRAARLPVRVPHHLFFGFEGGRGSDGTIAIQSQLDPSSQVAAKRVFGFPDDHTAILRSAAVSATLNLVLAAP